MSHRPLHNLRIILEKYESAGITLQRRFFLYIISYVAVFLALLILLLNLFGILNPTNSYINSILTRQLHEKTDQIERDIENTAACAIFFSSQLGNMTDAYLNSEGITFNDLKNDPAALTRLQKILYPTVFTNIQIAPCSGAFYMLDTTVNEQTTPATRNGIYIKYANLFAENTVNTEVALYRGASAVARSNDINLHSTWDNEMKAEFLPMQEFSPDFSYGMSDIVNIPGTWEKARFVYAPIKDSSGNCIGICGFEINDLYFQIAYKTTDQDSDLIVCGLLDQKKNGYLGQFSANHSGYTLPVNDILIKEDLGDFSRFSSGSFSYIGKSADISLGENTCAVAAVMPEDYYNSLVRDGQLKSAAIFFIIVLAALGFGLCISNKYIRPFIDGIEQYKAKGHPDTLSHIHEIDDLFAFLAERDKENEAAMTELESEKQQLRSTLQQMNTERDAVQKDNERLAYSRKTEVDPDDYQVFLDGLSTLSPMEKTVFNYYLEGKTVKEIIEIANIKESTVRFHNRNIYSKLGVKSLKQLLMYAAIMRQTENEENQPVMGK